MLLVILFPISFCYVYISLYWCTDGISVCYYLHCCIFNPESEYSTLSCLLWTLVVWYLATVAHNLCRAFYYVSQTYRITSFCTASAWALCLGYNANLVRDACKHTRLQLAQMSKVQCFPKLHCKERLVCHQEGLDTIQVAQKNEQ